MSLKIIKAEYGGLDVKDIIESKIESNSINIAVGNHLFTDPKPLVVKYLSVKYEINGTPHSNVLPEGSKFIVEGNVEFIPISCKCITYGRVDFIEEAIESFLRQEYKGLSEMIIVNDYPLQKLHFPHPRIRIYNLDFTFETIGEKENFAVSACKHDVVTVWDDDDLNLPNHLSNINKYFKQNELLHWGNAVVFNYNNIADLQQVGNSGLTYSKNLWRRIGGHAFENAGYDTTFVDKANKAGARVVRAHPPDDEVSQFYCWGNGSFHMSGEGKDDETRPNVLVRHAEHIENLRKADKIPIGDVYLKPSWNQDYVQLLKDFINDH